MLRRVLIANRGEIAVRIIRGLREAKLESVAIYTPVDRAALHVRVSDYAFPIEDYLDIAAVIEAARSSDADAIHPGYGFLSENAKFAEACESAGLTFIGPTSEAIVRLGSKTSARRLAEQAGVPVLPAVEGTGMPKRLPLMIKGRAEAVKGCVVPIPRPNSWREFVTLRVKPMIFGNGEIYIEKLIEKPRHIEVQILGDQHGTIVHLGERVLPSATASEGSRRSPSPLMLEQPDLRERMGEAAIRQRTTGIPTRAPSSFSSIRCEFFFLEMNTRLQVEHPVTERHRS
ncbi:MAG: biotin carboxylase N-terminal domain-containing protein [Bryobacteraceae bacterium]